MSDISGLSQRARALQKRIRESVITSLDEKELHIYLRELFRVMQPDYLVEVTHGTNEYGKDLVIVKRDRLGSDVVGVVVKKGDIRGQTRGRTDEVKIQVNSILSSKGERALAEIESQAKQALTHPAELPTILSQLPVSKVLIILAGRISTSGRTRLQREVTTRAELFDLDWLIEKFTEFYPQVFFEGKVIDFVQAKIQSLETKFRFRPGMNLSECFIEPLVADVKAPFGLTGQQLAQTYKRRKMPFSSLKQVLGRSSKVLLFGDPGGGKSTALAKLTIDMLNEAYESLVRGASIEKIHLPVLVTARDILTFSSVETLLDSYFGAREVRERFEVNLLLVDGLDEIPSTQRPEVLRRAGEYQRTLGGGLLISSRRVDIVKTSAAGFERYEVLPFEVGQAVRLFERLLTDAKTLTALREGLERIMWRVPMVPLSLKLLIDLVEERHEVPASVTELYEQFSDMVLGRWDKERGVEVLFDYQIKKRFLAALARQEFVAKGRLEISPDHFTLFIAEYGSKYGMDTELLEGFNAEIQRAGVLDIGESISFRHKSFLEYFAATDIYLRREDIANLNDYIVDIYFDDLWSEVAFFYFGLMREVSREALDKIETYDRKELWTDVCKLLAGRLLQAGWHSPSDQKYQGIQLATKYVAPIRVELLTEIQKIEPRFPGILADIIVLTLAELSLRSSFLVSETRKAFENFGDRNGDTSEWIERMVALLWANRRLIDEREMGESIKRVLTALENSTNMKPEDQARVLLILAEIERNDGGIRKPLKRKLERLSKKAPEIFRSLLPARRARQLSRRH